MDILTQLQTIPIIGYVPETVPLQQSIRVVDALLASPMLAVVVAVRGEDSRTLLADLRSRPGHRLLLGVYMAGDGPAPAADFTVSRDRGELWHPWINGSLSGLSWVWASTPAAATEHLQNGMTACVVPLWHSPEQTMAETITLARQFNQCVPS